MGELTKLKHPVCTVALLVLICMCIYSTQVTQAMKTPSFLTIDNN